MSDRFDCGECKESLYGRKYIQVEDVPHCIPCYDRLYANTCQECKELIAHNARVSIYKGLWSVLSACVCVCLLVASGAVWCYSTSGLCGVTASQGSKKLEYGGSAWHEDCFVCHGCEKPIGGQSFIPDKDVYYCVPCYEGRFAPRCSHCKKVNQGGVSYKDETWHKECLVCTGCKSPLAGQPFTSQGDTPYCVKCFSSLYAQKCASCNSPITGFGEGKYVSFQDRQWHQPCFKCSHCSVSLVGSGFFPDRDQILCGDCNNDQEDQ
uniref:Four and a half LIM domains 3 n=1 Tax=Hucho hucho TaxID=62062 RepID=A0A4W5LBU0_9TELE